jgi:hypothetical protein
LAFRTGDVVGHYELINAVRSFVATQGWQELEVDVTSANRLLWWKAPGLSGLEEIYVGIRSYQNVALDYYNLSVFAATGFVPGNGYAAQPGFSGAKGVPLWNQPIKYWMTCNGQRLVMACKIQNVYESFYLGKFSPYAPPSQFPYPVLVGGMLDTESATRYSETVHSSWFKGNSSHFQFRFVDGAWKTSKIWPTYLNMGIRNTNDDPDQADGFYGVYPLVLTDTANVYGELDGVFLVSGFNNATENVMAISGVQYLVVRDVYRTGLLDYMAMRLS